MGVPSSWAEAPVPGVGVKCEGEGGVKFCWNLLLAVCLVRSGIWSRGRKASFSGESDMASVQVPTDGANC